MVLSPHAKGNSGRDDSPVTPLYDVADRADSSPGCLGTCSRRLTLEQQWFRQFFIGILLCVNNGACFTFGIFSPLFKQAPFHFSQSTVNVIATVGVVLSYLSVPNGYLYDHYGPKATLLAGTILNVSGWAGMFLIFLRTEHPILSSSAVVVCFFYGLSQFSASFYETGSVLTNLRAFSCYKGRVVLIQKTFMGLGSAVMSQVYIAFFERSFASIAPFFLFLLAFSAIAGALSVSYVQLPTRETRCVGLNVPDLATLARGGGESTLFDRPFNVGTVILIVAVAFVLAVSMLENFAQELSIGVRTVIGLLTIALVASFASMIAVTPSYPENVGGFHESAEQAQERAALLAAMESPTEAVTDAPAQQESPRLADTLATDELTLGTSSVDLLTPSSSGVGNEAAVTGYGSSAVTLKDASTVCAGAALIHGAVDTETVTTSPRLHVADGEQRERGGRPGHDVVMNNAPLLENLRHVDIWLLWLQCFVSWGIMTLISSNISQIYQAIAYDTFSLTVNTVYVSIFGVGSAVGRVVVGALQPVMERNGSPMLALLFVGNVINGLGLCGFVLDSPSTLLISFFLSGVAAGMSWGSTVLVVTTYFSNANCALHYSFLYTSGMLSPLVFNVALFGPVYDHYSKSQGRLDDHSCKGLICIRQPVWACLVMSACVSLSSLWLIRRVTVNRGFRS